MKHLADESGLSQTLYDTYGAEDGEKILVLAILGVTDPCSMDLLEETVEDTCLRELLGLEWSFERSEAARQRSFSKTASSP